MDKQFLRQAHQGNGLLLLAIVIVCCMLAAAILLLVRARQFIRQYRENKETDDTGRFRKYIDDLDAPEIGIVLSGAGASGSRILLLLIGLFAANSGFAQGSQTRPMSQEPGIIIAIVLVLIPILAGILLMAVKLSNILKQQRNQHNLQEAERFATYLRSLPDGEEKAALLERKAALDFRLTGTELSGEATAATDDKGLLSKINAHSLLPFVGIKKKAQKRPDIDPALARLILWYIGCATFWLLFGTTVGEYMGIKFVAPDADHLSWLSFGRIRPVHTNAVFGDGPR